MDDVRFQYLWHEAVIRTREPEVHAALRAGYREREFGFPAIATALLSVERQGEGYAVSDGPDLLATVADAELALEHIASRVRRRALELASRRGWVWFAGMAWVRNDRGGAALVVGGDPDPGTTLLVRGRQVVGVPPVFEATEDGEHDLPGGSATCLVMLETGTPDVHLTRLDSLTAVRMLMENALRLVERPGDTVRVASSLVSSVPTLLLTVPTWEAAVAAAREIVLPAHPPAA